MKEVPVARVDISKDFSDICILSPNNAVFERLKISHDEPGMIHAVKALARAASAFRKKPVIVMESTAHYHRTLQQFLTRRKYPVITINPLQSSVLKNIVIRKVKNDPTDAYRLALAYRTQALRPNVVPSDKIENLRLLTRQRCDLRQDLTAYVQRFQSVLDQVFPGFQTLFERLNCETALKLLEQYPTPEVIKRARVSSITKIFQTAARRSVEYCRQRAEKLKVIALKAAEICLCRVSAGMLIRSHIAVIRSLSELIKQTDAEIHLVIQSDLAPAEDVQLLCSIPALQNSARL